MNYRNLLMKLRNKTNRLMNKNKIYKIKTRHKQMN